MTSDLPAPQSIWISRNGCPYRVIYSNDHGVVAHNVEWVMRHSDSGFSAASFSGPPALFLDQFIPHPTPEDYPETATEP